MNKEVWKDIKGYEGRYQISNHGRIKSFVGWNGHKYIKREKILNPSSSASNKEKTYFRSVVNLNKNGEIKQFKVHKLVSDAFLKKPKGTECTNHIDGNPLNNRLDNLEWCTQKENVQHAIDNDLTIHRINTIDRETVLMMLNNGWTYDEIAEKLNIAKGTVFNYIKRFKIKKIYL